MANKEKERVAVVKIADEVLSVIAALSATEAKGVVSLAGGLTHEAIPKSDPKNLQRALRIEVSDGLVSVKTALILDGTVSIPEVSAEVREKVSNAIELMTGMKVADVDVTISGVTV